MEEIILKSAPQIYVLSNKGYMFKHIKTGNTYTFIEILRSKNPLNREWYDAVLYCDNKGGRFCRSFESFVLNFKAVKDDS